MVLSEKFSSKKKRQSVEIINLSRRRYNAVMLRGMAQPTATGATTPNESINILNMSALEAVN